MKNCFFILSVMILSMATVSESRSETTCTWQGTKLIIGGEGRFDSCDYNGWDRDMVKITEIEFGDGVTTIGASSLDPVPNLKILNTNKVTEIEAEAFDSTSSLITVILPNVKIIGNYAFEDADILESVYMPKIQSIGLGAFTNDSNISYIEMQSTYIDDNGEVQNVSIGSFAFANWDNNGNPYNITSFEQCKKVDNNTICGKCDGYLQTGSGCVKKCNSGYLEREDRCVEASGGCGKNYRQFENFCNRIRYTPAEAAQVLRNDNTNEVTITFKK